MVDKSQSNPVKLEAFMRKPDFKPGMKISVWNYGAPSIDTTVLAVMPPSTQHNEIVLICEGKILLTSMADHFQKAGKDAGLADDTRVQIVYPSTGMIREVK